jgi:hypothetical protein
VSKPPYAVEFKYRSTLLAHPVPGEYELTCTNCVSSAERGSEMSHHGLALQFAHATKLGQ